MHASFLTNRDSIWLEALALSLFDNDVFQSQLEKCLVNGQPQCVLYTVRMVEALLLILFEIMRPVVPRSVRGAESQLSVAQFSVAQFSSYFLFFFFLQYEILSCRQSS